MRHIFLIHPEEFLFVPSMTVSTFVRRRVIWPEWIYRMSDGVPGEIAGAR